MRSPILKFEKKIQVQDQTRLNAFKSFVTKGDPAISNVEIKPGADGAYITVFDATYSENWFLDWLWNTFVIDVENPYNKIYFKRVSTGVEYTVTLTTGTYTLSALQAEIVAQLNAASAVVWTVGLSTKNEFTLTANEKVILQATKLPDNILPIIGFAEEKTDLSFEGDIVEFLPRKVSVRVTNSAGNTESHFWQNVYSVEGDSLFSSDADLVTHEPDILNWVAPGRNSFIDAHRRSQEKIMQWLDQNAYTDVNADRLKKFAILDLEDVRLWSTYLTLHHLFMSFQNAENDVFKEKANYYEKLMIAARDQTMLNIDLNNDGKSDFEQPVNNWSGSLTQR